MKLYEDRVAPNPRRVRVFLAEKGITGIEVVPVGIADGGILTPEFLRRNPLAQVPVLELDDGSHLSDSMAICRYFEHLQPEPKLFGEPGLDAARVEMWNRRIEFEIFWPIANVFRHIHPFFKGKHAQVAEFGEVSRARALKNLDWLDAELADGRPFIAGERFTVADITALCGIDFGRVSGIRVGDERPHLLRWHTSVSARPSAKA
ncbi:MAG: glutathione S-transferase family protein [Immundisolibacter sp.]|uniref:glutathione S-transferase family protein n=1 Tax=Immundisolibacter sp. TaxID=1934948 RepID=UPI003D0B907D